MEPGPSLVQRHGVPGPDGEQQQRYEYGTFWWRRGGWVRENRRTCEVSTHAWVISGEGSIFGRKRDELTEFYLSHDAARVRPPTSPILCTCRLSSTRYSDRIVRSKYSDAPWVQGSTEPMAMQECNVKCADLMRCVFYAVKTILFSILPIFSTSHTTTSPYEG